MLPVVRNSTPLAPFFGTPVNRLESLFDRFFGDDGGFQTQAWSWLPLSLWEDEEALHVEAELPGVSEGDVELTVHNGMLFIRGERKPEEGRRYLYNGRAFGRFERAITLPEAVKPDDVCASLKDGILSVTLPKSPESKPRKITLTTT
jgi:HSP20 family protein